MPPWTINIYHELFDYHVSTLDADIVGGNKERKFPEFTQSPSGVLICCREWD
jgi:hypothetical protein